MAETKGSPAVGEPFNPFKRFRGVFIPLGLLAFPDISDGAKLLYGRLCMFAGKEGECFADRRAIATEMGSSEATIGRQFEELIGAAFIRRIRRGRGLTSRCEFLWHPVLAACQRTTADSSKVSAQETVMTAHFCTSDRSEVSGGYKEDKTPLQDSLTTERAREVTEQPKPVLHFPQHQRSDWPQGGFDGPDDFEGWWDHLVRDHPNKNRNAVAKTKALEMLIAGQLNRVAFDEGYLSARTAAGERWTAEHGRYAPNLFRFLEDQLWKHAPVKAAQAEYPDASDYLRRIAAE